MKKLVNCLLLFGYCFVVGCDKEEDARFENDPCVNSIISKEPTFSSSYDIGVNSLAKSLSQAVRTNESVRELIHSEASRQIHGDYEFLIKQVVDKPITVSDEQILTRAGSERLSFGELLRLYMPETRSDENVLNELMEQYPDLQISVPVHA